MSSKHGGKTAMKMFSDTRDSKISLTQWSTQGRDFKKECVCVGGVGGEVKAKQILHKLGVRMRTSQDI